MMSKDFEREQEGALIRAFVVVEKQERLLELLSKPKRRRKILVTLAHFSDLDQRYSKPIPASQQTVTNIASMLFGRGAAGVCYVISENATIDGKVLKLEEALEVIVGMGMGTLVSCIPGRLGYYEGENPSDRLILQRDSA